MYNDSDVMFNKAAGVLLSGGVWKAAASGAPDTGKAAGESVGLFRKLVDAGKPLLKQYAPVIRSEVLNNVVLPDYHKFTAQNPYLIPGAIAAGTGLLSTAAAGNAITGLATAGGALAGWYGGQKLLEHHGNAIDNFMTNHIGEGTQGIGRVITPFLTAGAGSLLGAMIG